MHALHGMRDLASLARDTLARVRAGAWISIGLAGLAAGQTLPGLPQILDTDTGQEGKHSSSYPVIAFKTVLTGNGREDRIHTAWQDYRDAQTKIHYRGADDAQQTWSWVWDAADQRISDWGNARRPQIAAGRGSWVHAIWQASQGGVEGVYVNRFEDVGSNVWVPANERLLSDLPGSNRYADEPQICADPNGRVYAVWTQSENVPGSTVHIVDHVYFSWSSDDGGNWSAAQKVDALSGHLQYARRPVITCDRQGRAYVAYVRSGASNDEAVVRVWDAPTASWLQAQEVPLSSGGGNSWTSISSDGGGNVIVGYSNNVNVYANASTDFGATWSSEMVVNDAGDITSQMALSASAGKAQAIYVRLQPIMPPTANPWTVHARTFTFGSPGGWGPEQDLDNGDGKYLPFGESAIRASGSHVHAVWMRRYKPNEEHLDLMASTSCDGGLSWSAPVLVSPNPKLARSIHPQLVAKGPRALVVWDDRTHFSLPGTGGAQGDGAPEAYHNTLDANCGN